MQKTKEQEQTVEYSLMRNGRMMKNGRTQDMEEEKSSTVKWTSKES